MGLGGDAGGSGDFKAASMFDLIAQALSQDGKNLTKKVGGVYQFKVTKGPGGREDSWIVDAKNGSGSVNRGGSGSSDVTITMSDEDIMSLFSGKLNPQKAFFQGLLKIKGNMGLAMKLQNFLSEAQKLKSKL